MKRRQWFSAICPICEEMYLYGSEYKPATCGKFDCFLEANKRGLLTTRGAAAAHLPATTPPPGGDMPADVEAYYNERVEERR